jgi:hypothetical protein
MENPFKPTPRKRDPAAFLKAPVVKPDTQKTRARYTAIQKSLLDRQIPPRMVRYITQHFHARAKIDAFIDLYHQGCHLTGRPFSDRYDPKDPKPDACVPRKDGTLVCLPIYLLSQEGSIPDALLLAAARALVNHATRRPTTQPTPAQRPTHQLNQLNQPTPPKQPTQEPQNDTAFLFGMGPAGADHSSHHSDPAGQQHPARPSDVRVRWEWSDDTNSILASPVEPVHHAQ